MSEIITFDRPLLGSAALAGLVILLLFVSKLWRSMRRLLMGSAEDVTGKMVNVPNKPKTPTSTFRIPLELKADAQARAEAEGKTLTDVVVEALTKYAKGGKR